MCPIRLQHRPGAQFTGHDVTGVLLRAAIAIGKDGKRSWRDNVVFERLWRSVKCEEVSLGAYISAGEARASIRRHLAVYNGRRTHSSLDRQTPDQGSITRLPQAAAA